MLRKARVYSLFARRTCQRRLKMKRPEEYSGLTCARSDYSTVYVTLHVTTKLLLTASFTVTFVEPRPFAVKTKMFALLP